MLATNGKLTRAVSDALGISRWSRRLIFQNFALAVGYNALAVPVAVYVVMVFVLYSVLTRSIDSFTDWLVQGPIHLSREQIDQIIDTVRGAIQRAACGRELPAIMVNTPPRIGSQISREDSTTRRSDRNSRR